jgi:hypothetical protein
MSGSETTYGIVIAKDVMLPMRDGVHLAADIYRPAIDGEPIAGQLPTILARTSYDKSAQRYVESISDYFTPRGYAVVLQDLRGRNRSEGFGQYYHTANVNEGKDGYDTIEWIARQLWSNSKIGMVGLSHVAMVVPVPQAGILEVPRLSLPATVARPPGHAAHSRQDHSDHCAAASLARTRRTHRRRSQPGTPRPGHLLSGGQLVAQVRPGG